MGWQMTIMRTVAPARGPVSVEFTMDFCVRPAPTQHAVHGNFGLSFDYRRFSYRTIDECDSYSCPETAIDRFHSGTYVLDLSLSM